MFSSLAVAGALSFLSFTIAQDDPFSTVTTLASLHSTNPTAVPLTSINSAATGQPTQSLSEPATPGATPAISGAPPLPTFVYSPALGYPKLDLVPPVNSTLVQKWIAEVKATGINIPDIPISKDGSCASDPAKVANPSYCWWTCGGCTRPTDITTCPDKLTWGLSYDDGPSPYSSDLLNYLDANKLKSTFFIVGSRAISRPDILQAEYMSLHQLAVHTWSHPYLTTLTNEQIIAELGWTKYAMQQITGVTPLYMRPPYGDIDDRVRAISQAMNLTPVMWSNISTNYFDTDDWHIPAGYPVAGVIDKFESILNNASQLDTGIIVLEHDLYQQTVDVAIGYVLPDALARGNWNLESIVQCLHKPIEYAYIETNNNSTNPPGGGAATTLPASSSGTNTKSSTATQSGHVGQGSPTSSSGAARLGYQLAGVADTLFGAALVAVTGSLIGAAVVF